MIIRKEIFSELQYSLSIEICKSDSFLETYLSSSFTLVLLLDLKRQGNGLKILLNLKFREL